MTREQQVATRELEQAQENWLRSFGWVRELGGRWVHPEEPLAVSRFDALTLTRAQPLRFGSVVYARRKA
jgi:hypothetical protein